MFLVIALTFPIALLALPLLMERVERPLRTQVTADAIAGTLAHARPDDRERMVREGYAPAVERYWRRRRLAALLPLRPGGRD